MESYLRTRHPDTIHWWCLVQLLPLHWAHSGLEILFVCGEASLLLQVFSEAILIPQSTLSRYKSNCGRLLQHHHDASVWQTTHLGISKGLCNPNERIPSCLEAFKGSSLPEPSSSPGQSTFRTVEITHSSKCFVITGPRNQQKKLRAFLQIIW